MENYCKETFEKKENTRKSLLQGFDDNNEENACDPIVNEIHGS